MRLLLVQTPSVEALSSERVYPIGIVLLSGLARAAGYDTEVFDMNLHVDAFGALKEKLLDFEPDVVGFSLRNIDPLGNKQTSLVIPFVAAVRMTAALLPGATLIAGGTGFSLFPERIMKEVPQIACGIVGEAESSLPRLLASLKNPPSDLPGLCFRKGGRTFVNPPSKDFDMAAYTPADRRILDPRLYGDINSYVPAIGIESKRGCPYRCSYCVYPALQGRKLRRRPVASVVDEMEFLKAEYGIGSFHFTDPVLNIPEGHLEGICVEILRRKLKVRWDGFMREDMLTEKNVALFEKAGCECFSFSPDGLCTAALHTLGKGLDETDVLRAARLVARTDVVSVYHFMVNVPGETDETVARGMEMIEELYEIHRPRRNLGTIVLNNIRILPGTRIEAQARDAHVIGPDTDLLYPTYYNPPPYESLRYRLETLHFCKNVLTWQGVS
jgi:anaerobic magnesium-protoporphyrin IX monomethyl ester cyclase